MVYMSNGSDVEVGFVAGKFLGIMTAGEGVACQHTHRRRALCGRNKVNGKGSSLTQHPATTHAGLDKSG